MLGDVAVIIPHYNNGIDLCRSYASVMSQSQLPIEIIIIDDCSYDKSFLEEIEKAHDNATGVKLIVIKFENNRGPSEARNIGVSKSNANYIAFLDADDIWHPQKLEICLDVIIKRNLMFLYHLYIPVGNQSNINYRYSKQEISVKSKMRMLLAIKSYISTPTVLMHKSIFEEFPLNLNQCEDYHCWLSSVTDSNFYFVDLPLANGFKNSLGDSGLSANINVMHKSFLKSLHSLRSKKKISKIFFAVAYLMENIKFPLRFLR